jgi:hypothetical protein
MQYIFDRNSLFKFTDTAVASIIASASYRELSCRLGSRFNIFRSLAEICDASLPANQLLQFQSVEFGKTEFMCGENVVENLGTYSLSLPGDAMSTCNQLGSVSSSSHLVGSSSATNDSSTTNSLKKRDSLASSSDCFVQITNSNGAYIG